jgi:hypothetical protein
LVASMGPVSSSAVKHFGVTVGVGSSPPKLGSLVSALQQILSHRSRAARNDELCLRPRLAGSQPGVRPLILEHVVDREPRGRIQVRSNPREARGYAASSGRITAMNTVRCGTSSLFAMNNRLHTLRPRNFSSGTRFPRTGYGWPDVRRVLRGRGIRFRHDRLLLDGSTSPNRPEGMP